ncbi:ABC transporter permease subunit/CPBP intramembrane protease [Rosistilla oblonga]|uniref:ABC transporter permease subunit/CPBP intramembrane protease n=1 Tax=Rosistilla oblonga TaxID=2527990 RepID=UPI003A972D55
MQQDSQTPRFSTIRLIYLREMRDQLRDRRTIFTIAILPMLVYPLVGMLMLQMAQFTQQQPISICIVGEENLPGEPSLVIDDGINPALLKKPETVRIESRTPVDVAPDQIDETCQSWIRDGLFDAVVLVPAGFDKNANSASESTSNATNDSAANNDESAEPNAAADDHSEAVPQIELLYSVASDQSRVAGDRMQMVLDRWRSLWVKERLIREGIDASALRPFEIESRDIAPESTRRAAFWSKLLPFVMLVWAMTGAFYPAIDLVAGEKERGTLETLLCSPALRGEIVWGKLAAVTTFSIMTSLLNVVSMQLTATFAFHQLGLSQGNAAMGSPPIGAMLWLLLALFPLSALFSSLALAVAAMARSSKEGQYYLMPLMMVTLPLVLVPLLPGTTLSLGTSLIPVTGMFLLVRALVEGQYSEALLHLPVVALVTFGCLSLAVRWAQRQFENEDVLFRDGEQWDLGMWMRHLWRDRQPVASVGQALMCGVIVLMGLFFGRLMASQPHSWNDLAIAILLPQIGMILAPALLMSIVLTTSIRTSLRIRFPQRGAMAAALLLGFTLHPTYSQLGYWIGEIYPMSDAAKEALMPIMEMLNAQPLWAVIFMMAFVPAICEEFTFRGFIFGGLARDRGGLRAILVTALMFGFSHAIFQQSLAATVMGCVLGWIALRTGSVLPGIVLHVTNNALSLSVARTSEHPELFDSWLGFFLRQSADGTPSYQPIWIVISASLAVACLIYYSLFNDQHADDEEIQKSEREWIKSQELQASQNAT